ncbi:VPLPA-CTERM sorting domain-containing protein [Yoonia sp. SDW83-1]|uniref:VPLPA-CTERM sorting domain-containing protein n=1 Tax=Yoonia sp. SDW83-1 TaxID=3366945 RepID=UPI00398C2F02
MTKMLLISAIAALGLAAQAPAATLTFDEFSHGDVITSLNLEGGVTATVSANGRSSSSPDQAWIFDTTLSGTRDRDLEGPFTNDGVNYDIYAGRALIIQENNIGPDDDGNGGIITFVFSQAITFLGFDFLDDETVRASDNNGNLTRVGRPTGSAFDNYHTSSGLLNWANVTQLTFDFGRNSGAIDNLRYEVSQIPVPASLPLMLAALGGLGFMARRRKTA